MTIFVRKYPFSLLCILLIWTLSLLPFFPETPLDDVAFIDKWTHLVMYGGTCCVIWWEYLHSHQKANYNRLFLFAWLAPILMSGLLELLQEYCTTTRSGEWIDLLANTTGVTLAALIGLIYMKFK
ncbi:MAG: VanZ family protein [Prevotella sp.]|nr:VanZ family protein [Prevotella sp.]